MANKDDYLTYYREFFENFAQTVNPNDQLPVKLGSYKLINLEVIGGVIDWTTQYLTQKKCPQSLIAPLIQIVIDETRKCCKKQPTACGFNPADNAYEPLKLMQTVMAKTNEICLRYLDNSMLCSLPSPGQPHNVVSVCAAKNRRRRMEDRHVVIHDLNTMFNIQEASPSSYYAIFDGHAGHDAAAYSAAHLHQFLAESKHFVANPEEALRDAFYKTDALFIDKCNVERFNSGTTAVCALLRPKEKSLYIAWVGDSQALLVNQGRVLQCVNPHKPCRVDERERIEKKGGYVCYWGTWRVNGQLAVSRAIGDAEYKPYVIAEPDIREILLDGGEDFLILACDGLWDFLSEDDAARTVYSMVCQCPDKTDLISEHLIFLAKERGSADNISVIVVFLREPSKIAAEAHWANRNASPITMDTSLDNANNPFSNSNGADNNIIPPPLPPQKTTTEGLLLNLSENFKHNGGGADLSPAGDFYHNSEKANGKRLASEFDDDDEDDDEDLGPETDVDAVDDVASPSSIEAAKALADGIVNNNPESGGFNPFVVEKHEVETAELEIDLDLQKQQSSEFDGQRSPREETPTPPADAVHDGGLEDNVGDSGEESEDEWNYIKGEEANKENISPSQPDCEVADLLEEPDNMSQLNPNAAEFVPVSPTRSIPSPACRALIDDPVIAQSPKRPSDIDISLPNPQEFENEVKSRPSDFDSYSNGHDHEGDPKPTSQELMENLLNGKNIDDIPEFQPGSTPTKVPPSSEEFHFGPNAAPFTPAKLLDQSEAALSTKAVYGDESAATFDSTFDTSTVSKDNVDFTIKSGKEDDPMSMSFYDDKTGGEGGESFDLNKVQLLPENLEDFLNIPDDQTASQDDTILNLQEDEPVKQEYVSDEILLNNDERIQTTDLDKVVDEEKELASPVSNEEDLMSGTCELGRSPLLEAGDFVQKLECNLPEETLQAEEVCLRPESKSPLLETEEICSRPDSNSARPLEDFLKVKSPEPDVLSPEPETVPPAPPALSPEPPAQAISPELAAPSPVPQTQSPEPGVVSPEPQISSPEPDRVLSPEPETKIVSPEPEITAEETQILSPEPPQAFSPELKETLSPEPGTESPLAQVSSPEPSEELCQISKSPAPLAASPQLTEDVCLMSESPKPERILSSPQPELIKVAPEPESTKEQEQNEVCKLDVEEKKEVMSVESPVEDVTSSVKDVTSPVESPIPDDQIHGEADTQLNFAQALNIPVQEKVTVEMSSPLKEEISVPETCPISSTPQSVTDTESVLTADMNSFLERSQMADLTSPLSVNEGVLDPGHPLMKCVYPLPTEIKTETITPEFAEPTMLSPTEQTKEETPTALSPQQEETPSAPSPLDETVKEPEVVVEKPAEKAEEPVVEPAVAATAAVAAATAVGAAAAVAAAATVTEKKPAAKAKTPTSAVKKTSAGKTTATSPGKAAASPTKAKPTAPAAPKTRLLATTKTTTTTKTTPSTTAKAPATKPSPKPRTPTVPAAATRASTERKPLTNGDVKAPMKTSLSARKSLESPKTTTTTTGRPLTAAASKTSPTKSAAPKPATALAKPPTARSTTTAAASKPRPNTLVKTSTGASATAKTTSATITSTSKLTATKTTTSPKTTSPPKTRPATAPAKPRAPLTKTITKASADTEKQNKDSANKLTASRTVTSSRTTTATAARTTTVRRTETKTSGATRTTVTKTSTTTTRPGATGKKPTEITRTANKTTRVTKVEKPVQNGVSTVVTEQIMVNNAVNESDQQLMKDNSPIDNKLIVETNAAD